MKQRIFRNAKSCNNLSKVSLHYKKIANSLRKALQTYSDICIFYVIQQIDFQKQSMGGTLKVLEKSLKTFLDEVHFKSNLYSSPYSQSFRKNLPSLRKSFASFPGRSNSETSPLLDTSTISLVCIFFLILSHSQENQKNSIIKG